MKPSRPTQQQKLHRNQQVWALRILRLVRVRAINVDDPDVARAFSIIGFDKAAEIVTGGTRPKRQSVHRDAMSRRLPGSFETNPRRH